MKFAIFFSAALACATAAAVSSQEPIPIVKQEQEVNFDGTYHSSYETGNGISASEEGSVKKGNTPDESIAEIRGSYSYTGDDGIVYTVEYIADENGFQPKGAHLPVAPEIPEAIARSLEYNAAHPEPEEPSRKF